MEEKKQELERKKWLLSDEEKRAISLHLEGMRQLVHFDE